MSLTFLPFSVIVFASSNGVAFCYVDLKFFLVWFICPFRVSVVSG